MTEDYDSIKGEVLLAVKDMLRDIRNEQKGGGRADASLIRSLNSTLKTLVDLTKAEAAMKAGISGAVSSRQRGHQVFGAENLEEQAAALNAQIEKTSLGRSNA